MASYIQKPPSDALSYVLRDLKPTIEASAAEVAPLIERLRGIVPFEDHMFSGLDIPGCGVGAGVYLSTSFPEAFRQLYCRGNFVRADPIFQTASPDRPGVAWQRIDPDALQDRDVCQLHAALEDSGLAPRSGVTLWHGDRLYGATLFTRRTPFSSDEMAMLEWLGASLHGKLAAPVMAAYAKRFGLTKGEIACLQWAARGLTSDDIATETAYTVETVNFYVKAAIKKLGAGNRTAAIAEALRLGIID